MEHRKKIGRVGTQLFHINMQSIVSNLTSLAAQIKEFPHLYVTDEEATQMDNIETQVVRLVDHITERRE